jgi:hypothetical protein
MTDEQAIEMHNALAEYHAALAKDARLDIAQNYHDDLAFRLSHEAERIPERATARARGMAGFAG